MKKDDEIKHDENLTIEEVQELWKENRKLFWNRSQTMYVVEAATLWGAYTVYERSYFGFAAVVLGLGFWVMIVLILVMYRDMRQRDYFRDRAKDAGKYGDFGGYFLCLPTSNMVLSVPAVLALTNAGLVVWLLYKGCSLG